jgi:hypothetical protein
MNRLAAAIVCLAAFTTSLAAQAADSMRVTIVTLRDGSRLVGTLVRADADSVILHGALGRLAFARGNVARVRTLAASESGGGRFTFPSHGSRLVFGPTARVQARGDAYVANHMLFLFDGSAGIGQNVSLGGGVTLLPGIDLRDNLFYALPKIGLVQSERINVAIGALMGGIAPRHESAISFGIAYGVVSFGPPTQSISIGTGWGYLNGGWADRPALMVGGEVRVADRLALLTENYSVPGAGAPFLSFVARIYGERMSGDVGIGFVGGGESVAFPLLGLAIRF